MSLRLRISLTIFLVGSLVSLLTAWQVLSSALETSRPQVSENERFLLDVLGDLNLKALITEEYYELDPYLDALDRDPDILQVMLGDVDERVVASTRKKAIGLPMPARKDTDSSYWRVRDISAGDERYGLLAIEFSAEPLIRAEEEAYLQGLMLALLGVGISLILGAIGGILATGKLRMLMSVSEDIAKGNTNVKVGLPGNDEVGRLSRAIDAVMEGVEEERQARKTLDEGLRRAEQVLHTVMNAIPGPLVIKDSLMRWQEANTDGLAMFRLGDLPWQGRTSRELAQLVPPLASWFHADEEADRGALAAHGPNIEEETITNIKGRMLALEMRRDPIYNARGNEEGLVLSGRDLTTEMHDSQELQLQSARQRATLSVITEGVIGTNLEGDVVLMNEAAERLTAWSLSEAKGRPLSEIFHLVHQHTGQPLTTPLHKAVKEGGPVAPGTPMALSPRQGHDHRIDARTVLARDERGQVQGVLLAFRETVSASARGTTTAVTAQPLHYDTLTGLLDRNSFRQELHHVLARSAHQTPDRDRPHVLILLDLDGFRQLNDTLGQFGADDLLRQLGYKLRGQLRNVDHLARLDADSFALILTACPPHKAEAIAERLRATVADFRFIWEGNTVQVTASIGMVPIGQSTAATTGQAPGGDNADAWLRAMEATCFRAKELGGNRVHQDPSWARLIAAQTHERRWIGRFKEGFEGHRFQLYQQPAAALRDDRPAYTEVLARLLDENDKPIAAKTFLPPAEHFGVIAEIDRWAIHAFCEQAALAAGQMPAGVWGINLSAASLLDPEFDGFLTEQVKGNAIPSGSLCIEINEATASTHLQRSVEFVHFAKKLGCRVALDNVGSGTASFTTLKHLDVDFIKIAGGLIKIIPVDPLNRTLTETILRLAAIKGVPTIAQWVEDQSLLDLVESLGADYAQGYMVALPQPLQLLHTTAPD